VREWADLNARTIKHHCVMRSFPIFGASSDLAGFGWELRDLVTTVLYSL